MLTNKQVQEFWAQLHTSYDFGAIQRAEVIAWKDAYDGAVDERDALRVKYDRLREACLPEADGAVTCQLCGGLWWGNQTPRHREYGHGGTCPLAALPGKETNEHVDDS